MEDYRRLTLLNTMYKIYAIVLKKRLEKEMEGKRMLPDHAQSSRV